MDQVKLGIIGCSGFTYGFLYDALKPLPVRLVAVADKDEQARSRFTARYAVPAVYDDWQSLLDSEKPDAVISFPAGASDQFPIAQACLERDISVFSERPAAGSPQEQSQLISLQQRSRGSLMIRLNKRFISGYRIAEATMRSDGFGRPTMYMAKFQAGPYESEKALLFNHIVHHIDLARFFLGELSRIHVERLRLDDRRAGYNLSFVSESGAIGLLQSGSFQSGEYPMERVEITGEGTLVVVDNLRDVIYYRSGSDRRRDTPTLTGDVDTLASIPNSAQLGNHTRNGYENMLSEFISSVQEQRRPRPDFEDSARSIDVVRDIAESVG